MDNKSIALASWLGAKRAPAKEEECDNEDCEVLGSCNCW